MAAGPQAAALPHWVPAYVALGSNLGQPEQQVERAFEALRGLPQSRLVLRSSLYRSRPMGPVTQPDFVNAVAGLLTQLDARALPFSRCARCNGAVERLPDECIAASVPAHIARQQRDFSHCVECDQVYWPGSHLVRLRQRLAEVGVSI